MSEQHETKPGSKCQIYDGTSDNFRCCKATAYRFQEHDSYYGEMQEVSHRNRTAVYAADELARAIQLSMEKPR